MGSSNHKIVGVGLNKTGTSTLKECMRIWGIDHATYNLEAFGWYRDADWSRLRNYADECQSFENWPWALMYRELDEWYPEARFVLTVRKTPDIWFRSLCNHSKRMGPLKDFEEHIYGYADPCNYKNEHLKYYSRHNGMVQNYFRGRPEKLLVVCWDTGDGWDELAKFLDLEVPDEVFPHTNRTLSRYERALNTVRPVLGRYKRIITSKVAGK